MNISAKVQKESWFLKINPNGRIPALTDVLDSGEHIRIFESGSILLYLAERYDANHAISYPRGSAQYYEMVNWLFFQNAGLGPMQGQANHFRRYAPEKISYCIDRYSNETRRLYEVLNTHLRESGRPFLAGNHVSIADVSTFSWVFYSEWAGLDIADFPDLQKWMDGLRNLPAVQRGMEIPKPLKLSREYALQSSKWIVEGMKRGG